MGNVCCTDRRLVKSQASINSPSIPRKSISKQSAADPRPSNRKQLSIFSDEQFQFSSPVRRKSSIVLDMQESLIEELEYDLAEACDLSEADRSNILRVFSLYQHEIPADDQEVFEGFSVLKVNESESMSNKRGLLISNFAVYVLKTEDMNYVCRRIRLENIQVVLIQEDLKGILMHMASSDVNGDLWVEGSEVCDVHNCVQTMFRFLCLRYIPVYTLPAKQILNQFNSLAQSFIQSLMFEDNIKANNVIIQEGKIGENIVYNNRARCVHQNELKECVAVLTNKALYCLDTEFKFLTRMEIQMVKLIRVTEIMDKILIEKNNGENWFWMLSSKFVWEFEKVYKAAKKETLKILHKEVLNVEDFINNKGFKRLKKV
jgi:hypothetical protein